MSDVSALILAAGTSSRMGRAKQLLDLGGMPLLKRVIDLILPFNFTKILTVIGCNADAVRETCTVVDPRCRWLENVDYQHGQSSSLKKGMRCLQTSSTMIFLGDQPFIAEETIRMVFEYGKKKQSLLNEPFAVRPSFQGVPGHPVFLGNLRYIDFSGVEGDDGAKTVIRRFEHRYVLEIDDPGAVFDIDTPEDYEKAIRKWKKS